MVAQKNIDRSSLVEIKTVKLDEKPPESPEIVILEHQDEPKPSSSEDPRQIISPAENIPKNVQKLSRSARKRLRQAKLLTPADSTPATKDPENGWKKIKLIGIQATYYNDLSILFRKTPKILAKHSEEVKEAARIFKNEYKRQVFARKSSESDQKSYYEQLKSELLAEIGAENSEKSKKVEKLAEKYVKTPENREKLAENPKNPKIPSLFDVQVAETAQNIQIQQPAQAVVKLRLYEPVYQQYAAAPIYTQQYLQPQIQYPTPPILAPKELSIDFGIPQPIRKEKCQEKMSEEQIAQLLQRIRDASKSPERNDSPPPPTSSQYIQTQAYPGPSQAYPGPSQAFSGPSQVGPGYNLLADRWWEKPLPQVQPDARTMAENLVNGIIDESVFEIQLREQQARIQAKAAEEEMAVKNRLAEIERQLRAIDREDLGSTSMEHEFERREIELRQREARLKQMEEEFWRNRSSGSTRYSPPPTTSTHPNFSSDPYYYQNPNSFQFAPPIYENPIKISSASNKKPAAKHMKRRDAAAPFEDDDLTRNQRRQRRKRTSQEKLEREQGAKRSNFYDHLDPISDDDQDQNQYQHQDPSIMVTMPHQMRDFNEARRPRYTPPKDLVYVQVSDEEDQ